MSAPLVLTLLLATQAPSAPPEGGVQKHETTAEATAASSAAEEAAPRVEEAATLGAEALDEQGRELTARKRRLQKFADPANSLPDKEALQKELDVPDLLAETLRERANALRLELGELQRPPTEILDGGTADAGPPSALDPRVALRIDTIKAELAVHARLLSEARKAAEVEFNLLVEEQKRAEERAREEAQRAEEAKRNALESAKRARSKLLETVYARIAELEGAKSSVAKARGAIHEAGAADLQAIQSEAENAAALYDGTRALSRGSSKADSEFDSVIGQQVKALDAVATALEKRAEAPPEVEAARQLLATADIDSLSASAALSGDADPDVATALDQLRAATATLEEVAGLLENESHERWFQVAAGRLRVAQTLNDARLSLISRVSKEKSGDLHGFTADGLRNLEVAAEQIFINLRFHNLKRVHDILNITAVFDDTLRTGHLVMALLRGGVLLFAALWLWRRGPSIYQRLRKAALASARSSKSARLFDAVFTVLEEVGTRLFIIVIALWEHAVWSGVGPEPELGFIVEVLVWVLGYQLSARLVHMLILRLARRRHSLTVPQKLRILRSVRIALRYGVAAAFVLDITRQFVGAGVLYSGVRTLALLGGIPIAFVLIQRWREDIVGAYLKGWPGTRLSTVVESTKDQWYGFFLATAAFGFVAGQGLLVLGRDFILGFEQTRQALAYLFRLRIERQARKGGPTVADLEKLPERVREVFSDEPVEDDRHLVDRFGRLEELKSRIVKQDAHGGAVVIQGAYGMGRTTFLHKLRRELPADTKVAWFDPNIRLTSRPILIEALANAAGLDVDPGAEGFDLGSALIDAGVRAFVIDGLEWLFLRDLDGYEAVDALFDLVQRTRKQVLWIISAPSGTYRYLCRTRRIDSYVTANIEIPRWSEEEIRELIRGRLRRSGIQVSFEELLARDVEGAREPTQVVETEDGYIRLLWNFAEGNPRVAQHFWLRSLVPSGEPNRFKVRLYDAPAADDLEGLLEGERFFLAAFVLHRALAAEEVARVCHAPLALADAHIDRGLELGLYRPLEGGDDVYRITLPWWEAALRYLRRKNLL